MSLGMLYDDEIDEPTEFEPSPWGSRQRVLPRRTFKAVASVVALAPEVAPVAPAPEVALVPSLASRLAGSVRVEAPPFEKPIVREADIPTWRVPKLPLYPVKQRAFDLRLWLPIAGLVAITLIALLATRLGGELPANATSISVALAGETSDDRFHIVANVEEPPAQPAVEAPAPVHLAKAKPAPARAKHASRRPLLAVDVSTPLGDLAKQRRR